MACPKKAPWYFPPDTFTLINLTISMIREFFHLVGMIGGLSLSRARIPGGVVLPLLIPAQQTRDVHHVHPMLG